MWDPEAQEINDESFQSPDNSMPFARYTNPPLSLSHSKSSTSEKTVNALPYPDQLDHFQTENEMSSTFPENAYQETITVSPP